MAKTQLVIADSFRGMRRGLRSGFRSTRRQLDEPRELKNIFIDEMQNFWYPPGPDSEFHTFTSTTATRVLRLWNVTLPHTSVICQLDDGEVHAFKTYPDGSATDAPTLLFTADENPLWTLETDTSLYMGNETGTWKVDSDGSGGYSASSISPSGMPHGFDSKMFKGRRFVIERNTTIWFSDLNQPETFGVENYFIVGGDSTGGTWDTSPGSLTALVDFDDYLAIFATQGIWLLQGTTAENFQLRRTNALTGAWSRDSIARIESGVLFFGGTPRGELGIYLFTGNTAELMSKEISAFFRRWFEIRAASVVRFEEAKKFHAIRWNDAYVFSAEEVRTDEMTANDGRQAYVFNFVTGAWSTFDGWNDGPAISAVRELGRDRLLVSKGLTIYRTQEPLCRPPAEPGRITLGWDDEEHTAGLVRFIALKIAGWSIGLPDSVTMKVTATSSLGAVATKEIVVSESVFDNVVVPLNIRGTGIEVDITLEPTDDNSEVLIEQIQLITSRKGEKASRGVA